MKKLRILVVASLMASTFILVSAPSASANCVSDPATDPVRPCDAICQIGLGNKHTRDLFAFCYVW